MITFKIHSTKNVNLTQKPLNLLLSKVMQYAIECRELIQVNQYSQIYINLPRGDLLLELRFAGSSTASTSALQ